MSPIWPFRRRPSARPKQVPAPVTFHSRAMTDLIRSREAPGWRVLDLGATSSANLHFFSTTRARYAVEELYSTLAPCRSGNRIDPRCLASLPGLLVFPEATRFDAVLAWDLLNYLEPEAIQRILRRLVPWLRGGALIHALISREGRISARPRRYEMVRRDLVRQFPAENSDVLPSPRYVQPILEKHIAPMRVHKGYLLKLGLQEFLLELPEIPAVTTGEAPAPSPPGLPGPPAR